MAGNEPVYGNVDFMKPPPLVPRVPRPAPFTSATSPSPSASLPLYSTVDKLSKAAPRRVPPRDQRKDGSPSASPRLGHAFQYPPQLKKTESLSKSNEQQRDHSKDRHPSSVSNASPQPSPLHSTVSKVLEQPKVSGPQRDQVVDRLPSLTSTSSSSLSSQSPMYSTGASSSKAVDRLEKGVVVTVYSLKRKPEPLHLMVLPDISLLVCLRSIGSRPEKTVDLCRVQEIRHGKRSTDFERWSEEANSKDNALCLVLFYGSGTRLHMLSIAAVNKEELMIISEALRTLVEQTRRQPYQTQRLRWFRRQFDEIIGIRPGEKRNDQPKMTMKQFRGWLLKNSVQLRKKVLIPIQQQLCLGSSFKFDGFIAFVAEIMRVPLIKKRLQKYFVLTDGDQQVTPSSFLSFLKQEQSEANANEAFAKELLRQYWEGDSKRCSSTMNMTITDFEDFLFSPQNSIWDPAFNKVHQDMSHPMTDYWISSSHNTYLVGMQVKGQSSEEMYASCLRMGCRCLELDCWDGSDGHSVITHGFTMTSKIKLVDVLKVIKDNAWQASEYPIVLSLENHLSLPQQRLLASLLKDVFGDELLTEPVDPGESQMPSPDQLKRKIIIKDKKLRTDSLQQDSEDSSGTIKTGTLLLQDPLNKTWSPYTFELIDTSLAFVKEKKEEDEDDEEDAVEDVDYEDYFDEYGRDEDDEDEDNLAFQPWYYGTISKKEVKNLLTENMPHAVRKKPGDRPNYQHRNGYFLLRDSEKGGYALSFIWEGEPKHVKVKTKEENGCTLYTFGNEVWYSSVAELVRYFRTHRLYIADEKHHLYLDKPVCKPHDYIAADWYQPDMDRYKAEHLLMRIPQEGAFLVRGSSEPGCLSLSFRHNRKIGHIQIYKRGKVYVCGSYRFRSLQKMVNFFTCRPLYRKTKLTVAANESLAVSTFLDLDIYGSIYCDPSEINSEILISVRALYDFMAQDADQMSFTRGAVITNVREEDKPWWRGDYCDQKQKYFPANYVQVIRNEKQIRTETNPENADIDLKGLEDTLDLKTCELDRGPYIVENLFCFRIRPPFKEPLEIACESLMQLEEWVEAIKEVQLRMDKRIMETFILEKMQKRALELSNLIVYCQATSYDSAVPRRYYHISSLAEDKVIPGDETLLKASRQQMLRVYPKGTRILSTNLDPIPMWTSGVHMVALNYQTPDLPMQFNQARFLTNGGCGYVLKPSFLRDPRYSLSDIMNLNIHVRTLILNVTILAGRNICSDIHVMGVIRPFVCVEVIGLPLDNRKSRTKAVEEDNGLNPIWNDEPVKFDVSCPEMAFLRFEVLSEVNDSKSTVAQATFPVSGLRQGYRSVPLKNIHSQPLDMSSLLVHIDIKSPKDAEEENLFRVMEGVRKYRAELSASDDGKDAKLHEQLLQAEKRLLDYLESSRKRNLDQSYGRWNH